VSKVNLIVNDYAGITSRLIYVYRHENQYFLQRSLDESSFEFGTLSELRSYISSYIKDEEISLIHLHSMPFHEITESLFEFGLPVVRTSHEPMLTCPGWARFLNNSNRPCERAFGPMCVVNAFKEKCQRSRHPKRLLQAYHNVKAETERFFHAYNRLVVNSRYLAGTLTSHGADPSRVLVAPSPQFAAENRAINSPKSRESGPEKSLPIIFAGRVSRAKGIFRLIEAYERLTMKNGVETRLEIIGEGGDLVEVKQMVLERQISGVKFHGWINRDDLKEMFAQDCIAVVPSIYPDHFPNVVAEAMLAGAAVVASDAGGTSEWFEDGVSGLSFAYNDTEALIDCLEILIGDRSRRRSLASNGLAHISTHHSPEVCAAFYKNLYREVLLEEVRPYGRQ
ncbi:MAG TPA: glycosyltransferase family 4 protein, partial [Opitutales bacterium]|nr:glycosyltransferase family 4 protein [Opitutales bacterium]